MMSFDLPSVLQVNLRGNSISMERALKQIKIILEQIEWDKLSPIEQDKVNASIDDIEMMLKAIK